MNFKPSPLILTAGILLFPAFASRTLADSVLRLEVNCYFQEKTSFSSEREAGKVGIVRLDSKQLLKLLSRKVGIGFPSGSKLKIATDGAVYVASPNGKVLGDVSEFFGAKFDLNSRLFNGKRNLVTDEEKSRNYYPITFTMDLPGLTGTISGLLIEDYTVSPSTKTGIQFTSVGAISTVSGKGQVNGKQAYFEGNLNLQGRDAALTR